MTSGANVLNGADARWGRSVIAVARGAGGSAEIAAHGHGVVMHAGTVFRKLVSWNFVLLHVIGVCVAMRARGGDVQRMYFGPGICGSAEIVDAVAIGADRDVAVALGQQLSMYAGLVLAELVGSQRRVILAHERRIRMAAAAQGGNLTAFNFAAETGGFAHGIHIRFGRIAAVTTRTGQAFLRVDIVRELFPSDLQRRIKRTVAIDTGVDALRAPGHCSNKSRKYGKREL